ncbi:MAG: alpha-L-fucosidase [Planctomycetes bacterium]|nr:alpha-L-fucosidase [Planctomycetota bacterium]
MKLKHLWILLLLVSLGAGCSSSGDKGDGKQDARTEQDKRMGWWRDARLGMFIHWGLYSIPAGEWKGETGHAEWIRETAHIPVAEYEKFQAQFNPVNFDADAWAKLAADAGMKYLVITSKHHDGFCLFDSPETTWDVAGTPFKRDILAELSAACAKYGVRFCTYHSIMDWHHPDYLPRRSWEDRPANGADFDRYEQYLHAQVSEIVKRYHPGVMWFDGEWENTWNHERGTRLFELCRKLDPRMIVNNRVDVSRAGTNGFSDSKQALGDFATPEQEIPATGMPGVDWETCMTMNDHWGYNSHDTQWKSTRDLLQKLSDIASKGGNFLLNIGPRADGTFPPEAVERLSAIGAWMRTNASAIRDTQASPFDALPFGRCTQQAAGKDTLLNFLVFSWPGDGRLVVPGLGNEPVSAHLAIAPDKQLAVAREGGDLVIRVPTSMPDPNVGVVVLRVAGKPVIYRTPRIEAPATIFVKTLVLGIDSGSSGLEVRYTLDGSEPSLHSAIASGPIVIERSALVKARSFARGKPVSPLASAEFKRVAPTPAGTRRGGMAGLECAVYPGDFDRVPDFDRELPGTTLAVSGPSLPQDYKKEREARRYTGYLDVPASEAWIFTLDSDDGSQLYLDGQLVVDNDGLHSSLAKTGVAVLEAGPHAFEVRWFNKSGGAKLALSWRSESQPEQPVPESAYTH